MKNNLLYEIKIEYGEYPKNPSNIFYSMGKLIDSMNNLDNVLMESLPCMYTSSIILESIEIGSIRVKLKTIIMNIDDEALKELDWKKFIGSFLVRAKYRIIQWIDKPESISTKSELRSLVDSIDKIADEEFGDYNISPEISSGRFLNALNLISRSMKQMKDDEKAIYISAEGAIVFNKKFSLSEEDIELLITEDKIISATKEILIVKKPDYLGISKWEFYQNGKEKIIHVKLLDDSWLKSFQSGNIDLRPGDSMEVSLETSVLLNSEMKEISISHYLHKVYRVINDRDDKFEQLTLI